MKLLQERVLRTILQEISSIVTKPFVIEDLITDLGLLKEKGAVYLNVYFDDGEYPTLEITPYYLELETDEEYAIRISKSEAYKKEDEKRQYAKYLELKAIYENK